MLPPEDEIEEALPPMARKRRPRIRVLNVTGNDTVTARYEDQRRGPTAPPPRSKRKPRSSPPPRLRITDPEYLEDAEIAHVGKKLFLLLDDPDLDISDQRDKAIVRVVTSSGEDETVELEETLSHSGIFSGSFPLRPRRNRPPATSPARSNASSATR